jgi:hypothetical protein
MASKPTDLIITYFANSGNDSLEGYEPLKTALEDGYRVVDVFSTPSPTGGATVHLGTVVVTVVLSIPGASMVYRSKH